jgi:hypothetical protein
MFRPNQQKRGLTTCLPQGDLPLADRNREWDGTTEIRVRQCADLEEGPKPKHRDEHLWYDCDKSEDCCSYANHRRRRRSQARRHAARRYHRRCGDGWFALGVDLPSRNIDQAKNHQGMCYAKIGERDPLAALRKATQLSAGASGDLPIALHRGIFPTAVVLSATATVLLVARVPNRVYESILNESCSRGCCGAVVGSSEGWNAAGVNDRSPGDRRAALVGLKACADQIGVGVSIVVSIGVQLHEHQQAVGAFAVLQAVGPRLNRGADGVDESVQG